MFDVPRRARLGEPTNARPATGAAGVSGVSCELTVDKYNGTPRRRPARVSRPQVTAVSELYSLPSEDPRKLRRQESSQMRILLTVVLFLPLAAQTKPPDTPPAVAPAPAATPATSPVTNQDTKALPSP